MWRLQNTPDVDEAHDRTHTSLHTCQTQRLCRRANSKSGEDWCHSRPDQRDYCLSQLQQSVPACALRAARRPSEVRLCRLQDTLRTMCSISLQGLSSRIQKPWQPTRSTQLSRKSSSTKGRNYQPSKICCHSQTDTLRDTLLSQGVFLCATYVAGRARFLYLAAAYHRTIR